MNYEMKMKMLSEHDFLLFFPSSCCSLEFSKEGLLVYLFPGQYVSWLCKKKSPLRRIEGLALPPPPTHTHLKFDDPSYERLTDQYRPCSLILCIFYVFLLHFEYILGPRLTRVPNPAFFASIKEWIEPTNSDKTP